MWLELRSLMARDEEDEDEEGTWWCADLIKYMDLEDDEAWYPAELRMDVMGKEDEYLWNSERRHPR